MKLTINLKEGSVSVETEVKNPETARQLIGVTVAAALEMHAESKKLAEAQEEDNKEFEQMMSGLSRALQGLVEQCEKEESQLRNEETYPEVKEEIVVPQNLCDTLKADSKTISVKTPEESTKRPVGRPRKNQ